MKKQINVLFILLISSITVAQEQQRAEALLDEVSENLAQFNNISITFTYELVNRKELIQQKEKGSLIV